MYCWMLGLMRPIKDRRYPAAHLAVCGSADGRDVVVDGMLWLENQYVMLAKLSFPSLLMQFDDICHSKIASVSEY